MIKSTMRAALYNRYGSADVLRIENTARITCEPDEVLVAVNSTAINPYDWHNMTGTPFPVRASRGWLRPKSKHLGVDVAGVVECVGDKVSRFKAGDEVFGYADGCFAEFVCAKEKELAKKPDNISFEEAAAAPVALLTAIQGLRKHGKLVKKQHVLINGASGGVGTFAVQIAKHLDAEVTGVCGPANVELVKDLGADHVIDYSKLDFTKRQHTYDIIFDNIGNKKMSQYKYCLKTDGCYVVVGGPKGKIFGPLALMLKALLAFKFGERRAAVFIAKRTQQDIELIATLLASSDIIPVIDKVYPFKEIKEAFNHLESGRARGKIIVNISH